MSTEKKTYDPITSIEELTDNIFREYSRKKEWDTNEFMSIIHNRILSSTRKEICPDDVMVFYFRLYALLGKTKSTQSRIYSTTQALRHWYVT